MGIILSYIRGGRKNVILVSSYAYQYIPGL